MPIKRETPTSSKPSRKSTAPVNVDDDIYIPEEVNEAPKTLGEYSFFLYGDKGVGKSTLAAEWPDPLTFMFEPGRSDAALKQIPDFKRNEPPLTWPRFKKYLHLVPGTKTKTLIIDNADWAYECCKTEVEIENGWEEKGLGNVPHGAGWLALRKEWQVVNNAMRYMMACQGGGVVYISHSRRRETKSLSGDMREWIVPTCADKCWDYLKTCQIALYYGWRENDRVLHVSGSEDLWAGIPEGRFRDKKTNQPLTCILAGNNPKTTYQRLVEGFHNRLSDYDPAADLKAALAGPGTGLKRNKGK